tara:strand:+ start:1335 stop:1727 length:393 start_codon:yes stop_codon:yes gene_type:complete
MNVDYGGRRKKNKWEMLDEKVARALYGIDKKVIGKEIDEISGRIKQEIIIVGGYIAKAKLLAEEQGCLIGVNKMLTHARICRDSVYEILFERTELDISKVLEIQNNPLAIKSKRIYEIGELNIVNFFELK